MRHAVNIIFIDQSNQAIFRSTSLYDNELLSVQYFICACVDAEQLLKS